MNSGARRHRIFGRKMIMGCPGHRILNGERNNGGPRHGFLNSIRKGGARRHRIENCLTNHGGRRHSTGRDSISSGHHRRLILKAPMIRGGPARNGMGRAEQPWNGRAFIRGKDADRKRNPGHSTKEELFQWFFWYNVDV